MSTSRSIFLVYSLLVLRTLTATPLNVITINETPNGFSSPARGWNSFGLQQNPAIDPSFIFDQAGVEVQVDGLASLLTDDMISAHDYYISLDSGWSEPSSGDDHGRITYNSALFDIPTLADYVHDRGLKLGVYVLPGAFCDDWNKVIVGTNTSIQSIFTSPKTNNGFSRCNLDFSNPATQTWHNSVVALFAEWGVDLIKLDYVTPGSPDNGGNLPPDGSGSVIAYHIAIAASGRQMRLDISWKLERNETYFDIWENNADSMRTDQDINNSQGSSNFLQWSTVQRAIENYRQYIVQVSEETGGTLSIYPDMDNLYVANPESQSGVTDCQRKTIMSHWIGAGANLILGSDMTNVDDLGKKLITDSKAQEVAQFTQRYPMQPRNPGTGGNLCSQLQAWIAGPDEGGQAVVVLANYGPGYVDGECDFKLEEPQNISVTWEDLGIEAPASEISDVWSGTAFDGSDTGLEAVLDEGQSKLLWIKSTSG